MHPPPGSATDKRSLNYKDHGDDLFLMGRSFPNHYNPFTLINKYCYFVLKTYSKLKFR